MDTEIEPGAALREALNEGPVFQSTNQREPMKNQLLIALSAALFLAQPAFAHDGHGTKKNPDVVAQAGTMSQGEVRKVDKETKKITLKHGPIPNIDMPPMTMVFHVSDPAMLDQVKKGDKVKFSVAKVGDNLTITKIEPEK